jgi:coenzyme F420-dependent glucose-6-phosphate dehydrogenase
MIGYQASHEQFTPSDLLDFAYVADEAGFKWINSSDHLVPWNTNQGQSGFAWVWLGAAMAATRAHFSIVNAPGYRYNPVIIAQAVATICDMFPNRFTLTLGSGEEMNEHITGEKWPEKELRNKRLKECVEIMRKLWRGEMVTHNGEVTVHEAKLYTLPPQEVNIIGAAITPETAEWQGSWADGLITVQQANDKHKEVLEAFRKGGGKGKPTILKTQISYDMTDEKALDGAYDQWYTNVLDSSELADLRHPEDFKKKAQKITKEDILKNVRVSSDIQKHIDWIQKDIEMGFETIILHNVNRKQIEFIKEFGTKVLPHFA